MLSTGPQADRRTPKLPPFLRREAESQLAEIQEAVARVVHSGRFLFGDELRAFEVAFAASLDTAHAVGVGTGTDAIHLALRALGVGPGDEVITQSHSSPFTVIAISQVGARPVLVDSSEDDFGMDIDALERALTARTKVILPVHLYGHPVRIDAILEIAQRAGLEVVEDCAQAQGARVDGRPVGTFGSAGCFSFYPTKNLGALGDGGAVLTNDPAIAERIGRLRNGGIVSHGLHSESGITSRLGEVQAAVLRIRLPGVERANEARREHARRYDAEVQGVLKPTVRAGCEWAPHQYVIRHPKRDALRAALAEQGALLLAHYPLPIHLQAGFRSSFSAGGPLTMAERLSSEVLSLPTHPSLSAEERGTLARLVTTTAAQLG